MVEHQEATVITCQYNAKNMTSFLIKNMEHQNHPNLRLIIVDDYSTDQSFQKAKDHINNVKINLKVFKNIHKKGKKHAQKIGFQEAQSNNLILTDVDCHPASNSWASIMSSLLHENKLVLGHAPFFKRPSWLNKLQRYDNAWIAFQYMGFALNNIPYMGVGRNMAIKKSLYEQNKHKIKGDYLKSGDDDLLVQAINAKSIEVSLDSKSFMYSEAEASYNSWLKQKRRQISTSILYKWYHKILLTISACISILTPLCIFVNIFWEQSTNSMLLLSIYLIVLYGIKGLVYKKLNEQDLVLLLPILEVMYSIHLLILSTFVFFKKSDQWK